MSRASDERYEQLLAYLSTHMPGPFTQEETEDGLVFTGGEPAEVIVRLTDTSVVVEEFAIRWVTPFRAMIRPLRVGQLKWRRIPENELMTAVGLLIRAARATRLARYRECAACGKRTPPEWMTPDGICRSCAEREFGAVH